jgi:hypothetical protein
MKKIHIDNDNNWATPPDFYDSLNARFNFDFDPCPYNESPITPETDGLKIEWGQRNFINPPYTKKLKEAFVLRAINEAKKGKLCVMLLPVSTSTALFHEHILPNASAIEFVKGRIRFGKRDNVGFYVPKKNGKEQSGTKDSMIVVFGKIPSI